MTQEELESIIRQRHAQIIEDSLSCKTFNPGTLYVRKKTPDPNIEADANHELTQAEGAISAYQTAANLEYEKGPRLTKKKNT